MDESIKESNRCQFLKGLNNKTKLTIYKTFGGEVKFKRYLNGVGDAGTCLLFKLRSGTHGLNEELGRHRGREGKCICVICAVRTVKAWVTFCGIAPFIQSAVHYFWSI